MLYYYWMTSESGKKKKNEPHPAMIHYQIRSELLHDLPRASTGASGAVLVRLAAALAALAAVDDGGGRGGRGLGLVPPRAAAAVAQQGAEPRRRAGDLQLGGGRVLLAVDDDARRAGAPVRLGHAGQRSGDVVAAASPGLPRCWEGARESKHRDKWGLS